MNTLFSIIPRLALVFGRNKVHSLFLLVQFWFFFVTRKAGLLAGDTAFRFYFNQRPFTLWLRHPMDVAVLREIYIDKEYDWCPIEQPRTIIDLGAHFGDTTLFYHTRFPDAQIIAVEPAPESYERLVKNTAGIKNITCVQAAIGANDGTATLHLMSSSLGNSLAERLESNATVSVPQLRLRSLLAQQNMSRADLLKFDIEGGEFDMFRTINPADFAKAYIGEIHFDLGDVTKEVFAEWFQDFQIEWIEIRAARYLFIAVLKD